MSPSSHTTQLSDLTNRRSQRLHCDGVPFYKVGGKGNLTYSQAYAAILKDGGGTETKPGHISFSPHGLRRIIHLNSIYATRAHEFLLKKKEEWLAARKKAQEAIVAKYKVFLDALDQGHVVEQCSINADGGAVDWTPTRDINPNFDPSRYRIIKDGVIIDPHAELEIGTVKTTPDQPEILPCVAAAETLDERQNREDKEAAASESMASVQDLAKS